MKKTYLFIGGMVVLVVAYWLISPLWRTQTLDEALPTVQDNFDSMSEDERKLMNEEVDAMQDTIVETAEPMPAVQVLAEGAMVARAHDVEGRAQLIRAGTDLVLRFEDLATINGPDLRIYLSKDLGVSDAIDLGAIRATNGNVNYDVPDETDTEIYRYALIWCRAFRVLFSYAVLE